MKRVAHLALAALTTVSLVGLASPSADAATKWYCSGKLTNPAPAVRAAFARHPNLPPSRLAELLDDEELVHHAAANPALPTPAIRALVGTRAGSADGE